VCDATIAASHSVPLFCEQEAEGASSSALRQLGVDVRAGASEQSQAIATIAASLQGIHDAERSSASVLKDVSQGVTTLSTQLLVAQQAVADRCDERTVHCLLTHTAHLELLLTLRCCAIAVLLCAVVRVRRRCEQRRPPRSSCCHS
jgi:hypothetical protein